jgi:hypothetical protein
VINALSRLTESARDHRMAALSGSGDPVVRLAGRKGRRSLGRWPSGRRAPSASHRGSPANPRAGRRTHCRRHLLRAPGRARTIRRRWVMRCTSVRSHSSCWAKQRSMRRTCAARCSRRPRSWPRDTPAPTPSCRRARLPNWSLPTTATAPLAAPRWPRSRPGSSRPASWACGSSPSGTNATHRAGRRSHRSVLDARPTRRPRRSGTFRCASAVVAKSSDGDATPSIQQRSRVSMVAGTSGTGLSGSAATACSRRRKPTSSSSGVKQAKVE